MNSVREATWCSNNVTGWAPNNAVAVVVEDAGAVEVAVAVAVVGEGAGATAEEDAGAGAEGGCPEPVARAEGVVQKA